MSETKVNDALSNKFANMSLFCSFLVIFIHTSVTHSQGDITWWTINLMKNGFCRIAVPFFFLASGFFLVSHIDEPFWWRKACKKRLKTILIPYLIWSTLFFVFFSLIQMVENHLTGAALFSKLPGPASEWLNIYGLTFAKYPYCFPLWYLRWLLVLTTVSYALVHLMKSRWGGVWLFLLFLAGLILSASCDSHRVLQSVSFPGTFFFCSGIYIRLHPLHLSLSRPTSALLVFVGMATFITYLLFFPQVPEEARLIAIIPTLIGVWNLMPSTQLNPTLRSCPFPVYLMHIFFLITISAAKKFIPQSFLTTGIPGYLLNVLLSFILSIITSRMIRKQCPGVARILFGGR